MSHRIRAEAKEEEKCGVKVMRWLTTVQLGAGKAAVIYGLHRPRPSLVFWGFSVFAAHAANKGAPLVRI